MKILLGKGVLSWPASERRSDRYGMVMLMGEGTNSFSTEENPIRLLNKPETGLHGDLVAIITGTRKSTHIGDLFRGFFPETPKKGETIKLGTGSIFYEVTNFGYEAVGLLPEDGRSSDWLDPKNLYRCHEQSVDLYFDNHLAV